MLQEVGRLAGDNSDCLSGLVAPAVRCSLCGYLDPPRHLTCKISPQGDSWGCIGLR